MKLVIQYQPWEQMKYGVYFAYTTDEIAVLGPAAVRDCIDKQLYPQGRFATEEDARAWCELRQNGEKTVAEYELSL